MNNINTKCRYTIEPAAVAKIYMRWAEPLLKTSTQRQLPSPKHQAHPLYPLSQANLLHPFHTHVRYTLHITHYFLLPIPHTAHSVQQAAYSTRHTAYRTQQINIHAYGMLYAVVVYGMR